MSKSPGLSVVLALLFLVSTAGMAAQYDRTAEPLGSFLSSVPQGETAAAQAPLFLSRPSVDCSEFDHYDCYYYWDWESNCCVAPNTPNGDVCPFACF